tara:strand:- start:260 stop:3763 length:3504 start_codon:yes stop_codon:yes gene_type:complete
MTDKKKFYYPPAPPSGAGTFSDDLVGFQYTQGSAQMTLGNFNITDSSSSSQDREFNLGGFSGPITLEQLSAGDTNLIKYNLNNSLLVEFNYDNSDISKFVQYGSLKNRFRVAAQQIVNFFPAALYSNGINQVTLTKGNTIETISYDVVHDRTTLTVSKYQISNPFDIEFTDAGELDFGESLSMNYLTDDPTTGKITDTTIKSKTGKVSPLRNFSKEYSRYSLTFSGSGTTEYAVVDYTPIEDGIDNLTIVISGSPFGTTATSSNTKFYIKPNNFETQTQFNDFDAVEKFLLNQKSVPQYKAEINLPRQTDNGQNYVLKENVIWEKQDLWNIDVTTQKYTDYLQKLVNIGDELDDYKTNLVSRFLTTGALKDFDSDSRKVEKTLQIYGRSFDDTKKFIDGIAYMNNITYDGKNNVPNQLLRNLAKMLGWKTPSTTTKEKFLDTVLDRYEPQYSGESIGMTPAELDVEIYRRILMNTSFLFKSKGTRKAIEFLFRFIGAPEALTEFNEYVVLADCRIKMGSAAPTKDPRCNKLFALLNASTNGGKGGTKCPPGQIWDPVSERCETPHPKGPTNNRTTPEPGIGTVGTTGYVGPRPTNAASSVSQIQQALSLLGCEDDGTPGFLNQFQQISGGVSTVQQYILDPVSNNTLLSSTTKSHGFIREDYPIDDEGYPTKPRETTHYYFQRGAGWFEETEEHHGVTIIDKDNSVLSGCTPKIITKLNQFSWGGFFGDLPPGVKSTDPGAPYLERFRHFPYMKHMGFGLKAVVDDKKSWVKIDRRNEDRVYSFEDVRYADYHVHDERYILNVKNVDIFLNVGQALVYDVWQQSVLSGCPFSGGPLPLPYPQKGGVDDTVTLLNAKNYSFKEFVNTFWRTFINVRNRQTIDDGKTGGYPLLQKLYIDYLSQMCGENNQYTYTKMVDYAQSLGTYWIRIIEQLVPVTTLWQGGVKVENSLFHRDKFTYKHYPVRPLPGFNNPTKGGYVPGCTDPSASNFNPLATAYDGSCEYDRFGGQGKSSDKSHAFGETFSWVGLTSPNTGTTCSSGCQNTGGTQTKIGPIASTTISKPCTCCSLPENSMVLQMRPLSATCKSVWASFIDYNGHSATTSNPGVNNSINLITERFASNDSTINGAYDILSTMNNNIMFRVKRTLPLSKNKKEPWGYKFDLEKNYNNI